MEDTVSGSLLRNLHHTDNSGTVQGVYYFVSGKVIKDKIYQTKTTQLGQALFKGNIERIKSRFLTFFENIICL